MSRGKQFNVRLSEGEDALLNLVATRTRSTRGGVVRELIKRAGKKIGVSAKDVERELAYQKTRGNTQYEALE